LFQRKSGAEDFSGGRNASPRSEPKTTKAKEAKKLRGRESKSHKKQKSHKNHKSQEARLKNKQKNAKKSYSSTKMPNTSKHQMIGYGWIPPAGVEQVSLIKSPRSTQPVTPTPSSCGKSMKATWFLEQS